jgi:hypothetical protein
MLFRQNKVPAAFRPGGREFRREPGQDPEKAQGEEG